MHLLFSPFPPRSPFPQQKEQERPADDQRFIHAPKPAKTVAKLTATFFSGDAAPVNAAVDEVGLVPVNEGLPLDAEPPRPDVGEWGKTGAAPVARPGTLTDTREDGITPLLNMETARVLLVR